MSDLTIHVLSPGPCPPSREALNFVATLFVRPYNGADDVQKLLVGALESDVVEELPVALPVWVWFGMSAGGTNSVGRSWCVGSEGSCIESPVGEDELVELDVWLLEELVANCEDGLLSCGSVGVWSSWRGGTEDKDSVRCFFAWLSAAFADVIFVFWEVCVFECIW